MQFVKNKHRRIFSMSHATLILFLSGTIAVCSSNDKTMKPTTNISADRALASLTKATAWINSQPLTERDLKRKVVLIDVCTYTCINWLRTLPFIRAWDKKYKSKGLVVIGVHTPEFSFEEDIANVQQAVKDMNIAYPIAMDNNYEIWSGFSNQYWPALYLIDGKGKIRYYKFGEGDYQQIEEVIQQLLKEAGATNIVNTTVSVDATGVEVPADWANLRSPENYLGYERTENFASPGGPRKESRHDYTFPSSLSLNQWGLSGNWMLKKDRIILNKDNGRLSYRFHARDLHLVMGPLNKDASIRFRILIDGKPPGNTHGVDIDAGGNGIVTQQRLYQLIRQPESIAERQFEIEFLDTGIELFAFTFG